MNGHEQLVHDIEYLLMQVKKYEFHDFKNNKFGTPKIELARKLFEIRGKVINGIYDNSPDE